MVDEDIRMLFGKVWAKMRKDYSDSLREHHIHVGQDHALCQLWQEDGVTQTRLCELMGCEPPTLTNMLKKLEEYGLVTRVKDAIDARVTRVFLTEEGRELKKPVFDIWKKQQDKMLSGIDTVDRFILKRLLTQMDDNLNK